MRKYLTTALVFVTLSFSCLSCQAVEGAAAPQAPSPVPPNDRDNFAGDRLVFPFDLKDNAYDDVTGAHVCIKKGTRLTGIGSVENDSIRVKLPENLPAPNDCSGKPLDKDTRFIIKNKARTFYDNPPDRFGWTWGALVVPYKLELSGNKELLGGSSVGLYFGRRLAKSSVQAEASIVIFAGATSIPVSQTVNGQANTQNFMGVTGGFGILGTVKDAFHLGVVFGWDHVGKGVGYQYNNRPWVAAELGYDFAH